MPEDSVQVNTPTDAPVVSDNANDNARLVEDAATVPYPHSLTR